MYFSSIKNITYNDQIVKDIFTRVRPADAGIINYTDLMKYHIKDYDTPETIAYELYGDSELHWVIILINDIQNIHEDWPLGQMDFNIALLKKYPTGSQMTHHYEDEDGDIWDYGHSGSIQLYPISNETYEERINNSKMNINILNPAYVDAFIEKYTDLVS
jgi:hypothetical protein